eukprot:1652817-Rhodomonas_salina.1
MHETKVAVRPVPGTWTVGYDFARVSLLPLSQQQQKQNKEKQTTGQQTQTKHQSTRRARARARASAITERAAKWEKEKRGDQSSPSEWSVYCDMGSCGPHPRATSS